VKARRILLVLISALIAVGSFSAAQQIRHGDAVTGLGTVGAGGVVWGLYVVGDGFFASVGLASLILAAVLRLCRAPRLERAAQNAVALAIASLLASVLCVLADLGRAQAALINLPLVGRARAPFFGTFTLVAGASLFAAVVQWFLASRPGWVELAQTGGHWLWRQLARGPRASATAVHRRNQVNFWFGLSLLPLLLLALGILARVFCERAGRPTGLIHLETLAFMLSAGAAACSLVLLTSPPNARASLARTLSVLLGLSVVLVELAQILAMRSPGAAIRGYSQALLLGPWKPLFWAELVLFLAAGALVTARLWKGQASVGWTVLAAGLVCPAVFIQRFLLVVAWQTHGLGLSWPKGHYQATGIEWGLLLGIAALATSIAWLLVTVGPSRMPVSGKPGRRQVRRSMLTAACVLLGGALAAAGLALSAGVGSGPYLDPMVPGAPLIFLGGLLLALAAPVVYELLPDR
jgi:Ni/Fe-hydrogenase subunit HybB-like protein